MGLRHKQDVFRIGVFILCLLSVMTWWSPRVNPSPLTPQPKRYMTWEWPYFAGINNQVIMTLGTAVVNPLPGREVVIPDYRFMPRNGLKEEHYMSPAEIFNRDSLRDAGYLLEEDTREIATVRSRLTLGEVDDLKSDLAIIAFDENEGLWRAAAQSFVVWNLILPWIQGGPYRHLVPKLEPSEIVEQCAFDSAPELKDAVTIHVRTWKATFNLFGKSAESQCPEQVTPVLGWFFGSCGWDADYLMDNIERVQRSVTQPVLIATDDSEHPMIVGLLEKLGGRGRILSMSDRCRDRIRQRWPDPKDHEWRMNVYPTIIDSVVLSSSDTLLGSFFSTFSQIAAVRSEAAGNRVFFLQNRLQRLFWPNRGQIILAAATLVFYATWYFGVISKVKGTTNRTWVRIQRAFFRPTFSLRDSYGPTQMV